MSGSPADEPQQGIRIPGADLKTMLDRLDAQPVDPKDGEHEDKSIAYRIYDCSVSIQQPGSSSPITFVVTSRNLSTDGMSFLHGNFVHDSSKCVVRLLTLDERIIEATGTVVRCR